MPTNCNRNMATSLTSDNYISQIYLSNIYNYTAFNDDNYDPDGNHVTNPNFTEFREVSCVWEHLPIVEIVWKSVIVFIIVLIGLLGNFTVIFLVLKRPKIRQQPVNIFTVNLAVADFLTTLFTPIVSLLINIYQNYELGPVMCKLDILIKMMCILASIFSVIAISFERFQNISHSGSTTSTKRIKWRIVIKLIIIWLSSIALSLPLAMWRTYQERQWSDYLEKWCTDDPAEYSKNYWIFLMSPLIYFPLVVLIIIYSLMAMKIDKFIRKMQQQTVYFNDITPAACADIIPDTIDMIELKNLSARENTNSVMNVQNSLTTTTATTATATPEKPVTSVSSICDSKYTNKIRDLNYFKTKLENDKLSANSHKRSIMITILVYCVITIVLWTPLQVLVYYRALKPERRLMPDWYEPTKFIAQLLCSVNSAINPFITFRRTFAQLYRQFRHKKQQKRFLEEWKKKNLVIAPPISPKAPNPHHHHHHSNNSRNILSSRYLQNQISTISMNRCNGPMNGSLNVSNVGPYIDGITPISSSSGTPSRKAASLSKQVLMKYSPSYFDVETKAI